MKIPILLPHRADFIIWTEPGTGTPYGMSTTPRGEEVYGPHVIAMLTVEPHEFWGCIPDDVIIGVLTEDNGLQYASKNCLQ